MTTKMNEDTRVKMAVYRYKIELIIGAVADHFGIKPDEIGIRSRRKEFVEARRRVCYYAKEYSKCPLSIIGYFLNKKNPYDHASVINYQKNHSRELKFRKKDGSLVYPELQKEDYILRREISKALHLDTDGEWLEDFSVSSGNFLN